MANSRFIKIILGWTIWLVSCPDFVKRLTTEHVRTYLITSILLDVMAVKLTESTDKW
jgi:hypothetical protein